MGRAQLGKRFKIDETTNETNLTNGFRLAVPAPGGFCITETPRSLDAEQAKSLIESDKKRSCPQNLDVSITRMQICGAIESVTYSIKFQKTTMPTTITRLTAHDIRFPTSRSLDGSDAMNPDPDYSAAYVELETDRADGVAGHGMTFTIGRGNELCVAAIEALAPLVVGRTIESFTSDMAAFWRHITSDSQLRWVGPDKGVIHLATGAVVNAVWDLWAKIEQKPLWRLVAEMTPEQFVGCVDFRYLHDVLTPDAAIQLLRRQESTKSQRIAQLERDGYPAYTTSAGWLGYDDEKLRRLCRDCLAQG
jgi:L-fuconate dehydratase